MVFFLALNLGDPLGPVLNFTSNNPSIPIHSLGAELNDLGWTLGFLQNPNALRLIIGLNQTRGDIVDDFVEDLIKSCEKILETLSIENKLLPTYPLKTVFYFINNIIFCVYGLVCFMKLS